ncbi:MAG: benzoyl-CoA reductase subunit A [Haloarculaceae archaeon]|jgi:benzoyl-CoA reductase subunit A
MSTTATKERTEVNGIDGDLYELTTEHDRADWEWPTTVWLGDNVDQDHDVVSLGFDIGSTSTQAVIMGDKEVVAYSSLRTGSQTTESARKGMEAIYDKTDALSEDDIDFMVGTGYGRVNLDMVDDTITEIACHAKGANYFYGSEVRTLLDMGGQDLKAIRIDEKGKVENFLMNDKCAAGTGRGVESFSDVLGVPIEEIGGMSLAVDEDPEPVSSTCVVFARDEATALLREDVPTEDVAAAYHLSLVENVQELLERVSVEPEFAITGGIAKNPGVVQRLEERIGQDALEPDFDTQIAGAAGAAFFAAGLYMKQQG